MRILRSRLEVHIKIKLLTDSDEEDLITIYKHEDEIRGNALEAPLGVKLKLWTMLMYTVKYILNGFIECAIKEMCKKDPSKANTIEWKMYNESKEKEKAKQKKEETT